MPTSVTGDSSDNDLDWEEVHVPGQQEQSDIPLELELSPAPPRRNIEITLQTRPKKDDQKRKAAAALHAQRVLRTTCHKIHTVALLANARTRNKWLNDPLLHARLLSITPLALQNGFAMIHKSRVPDHNKRGRLFEAAVDRLVTWWCETCFDVAPTGHIRSRTFEDVENEIASASNPDMSEPDDSGYERIRSVESLMKHVLMQRGSRDTSAQLFTALCRSLDIPARLVVSLQSVPWKSALAKSNPNRDRSKGKGKPPQRPADDPEDVEANDEIEMCDIPVPPSKYKGKGKVMADPVMKLRAQKSQSTSRSGSPAMGARSQKSPDPTTTPPVFWTEVFSRPDMCWFPVDPIRGIVNKRRVFDPSYTRDPAGNKTRQDNRMLYVIGIEEDGFGRDLTARYAREYTAKVSKVQAVGAGPAGGRKEWWDKVVLSITRPYRLQRDDLEDEELHTHQLTEGMPTTIAGFKNHPLYALTRHLRRDQVIDPPTELGKFRGEPVYPRSSVISLKTAENWMRQGRVIRQGCQPMKMVKQRAMTVSRQREMELAIERARAEGHADGDGEVMQGMYALSQTELYVPEPIRDGKIPKNDFGNIDLYVPSMLPQGAAHIPFKRAAKIAKKLEFDYAEAVTGFEFRKRRAMPVIQGVVVAAENENVMMEACLEAEQDAEERARAKRLERACKRWIRLVHGLRIRERLQKQYALPDEAAVATTAAAAATAASTTATSIVAGSTNQLAPDPGQQSQGQRPVERRELWLDTDGHDEPGGYLTTADDVVQPFHLPQDVHRYDPATAAAAVAASMTGMALRPAGNASVSGNDDHQAVVSSYARFSKRPLLEGGNGNGCSMNVDADATVAELDARDGGSEWWLDGIGEDDEDAEKDVDMEVVVEPEPLRRGVPKTMRELAESYAQRQGEREGESEGKGAQTSTPPPPARNGHRDVVTGEMHGASPPPGAGPSRRTRAASTAKRGSGASSAKTVQTRTSKKRPRRRGKSKRVDTYDDDDDDDGYGDGGDGEDDDDGEGEGEGEGRSTPAKRHRIAAASAITPASASASTSTSTPVTGSSSNTGSGRVLRPRRQKSAARVREDS